VTTSRQRVERAPHILPRCMVRLGAANRRILTKMGLKYDGKEMVFDPSTRAMSFGPDVADRSNVVAADLAPNLALPWVLRLRYAVVVGEAAIILGMAYGLHLDFPLPWTLAPLAVVLASNIWLARMRVLPFRFPQGTLGAVFCLDTLCLSVILGLTGGPTNPFSLLYLVQITLSAVVLRKVWTWVLGALSTACFGLLFFFHVPLAAFQGHHVDTGLFPHLIGMWIAFVIAAAMITFFTGKIADALRTREQEVRVLQDQIAKNERLASLVTLAAGAAHELGTPLATIAVAAKELERYAANLSNRDGVFEDAQLIRAEVDRCRRILERMSAQSAEPRGHLRADRTHAAAGVRGSVQHAEPRERGDVERRVRHGHLSDQPAADVRTNHGGERSAIVSTGASFGLLGGFDVRLSARLDSGGEPGADGTGCSCS
jgi:two-component system sensor histidine kinase RegB